MIKVIGKREILEIMGMFLIVQLGGLILVALLKSTSTLASFKSLIVSPDSVVLSYILDAILIFVILLLFLNRSRRQMVIVHDNRLHKLHVKGPHIRHHHIEDNMIYGTLEAAVVVATSFFFFLALFDLINAPAFFADIFFLALGAAIFLIAAKDLYPHLRNSVTIISSIGIGLLLGMYFNFEFALIALAVVSIYDYISVFITKSMIKIAHAISKNDIALMISSSHLESVAISKFPSNEVKEYKKYLHDNHEDENPKYEYLLKSGRLPIISQLQLGEGDLGLPLMAAVSAYLTYTNYVIALAVVIGGAIGLLAAIRVLAKYRHALPAIPPLFAFISIFSGIAFVLTGTITTTSYNPVILIAIGFAVISFGMVLRYVEHKEHHMEINEQQTRKSTGLIWKIP